MSVISKVTNQILRQLACFCFLGSFCGDGGNLAAQIRHDGTVDGRGVLERLGARIGGGVSARKIAEYGIHFEQSDENRDGKHSSAEFVENGSYLTPIARRAIFQAADTDSDGFVTHSEYILNRIITDEAKAIMQAMDENGDGVIQRSEFIQNE